MLSENWSKELQRLKMLKKVFFLPLKRFSYSIVKSKESAEEIVSDIFVEIWARIKQLLKIEVIKTYIYVSVRIASLKKNRQTKKCIPLR